MPQSSFAQATVLGYPRLGRRRELKHAIESFWQGAITEAELEEIAQHQRRSTRQKLADEGLSARDSAIPESFSWYDQVLDAAFAVGATSPRFSDTRGSDLERYFALARGTAELQPLEMTKWFDTNYHYSVPEIAPDTRFTAHPDQLVRLVTEAAEQGFVTRPTLVGPVTLLALSKPADGAPADFQPLSKLPALVSAYADVLESLYEAGAQWIQLDEPALVADTLSVARDELVELLPGAYEKLGQATKRPSILVTTPYGDAQAALPTLQKLPIEAIHLDLVSGRISSRLSSAENNHAVTDAELSNLAAGLGQKKLIAGIIDGRNIWRTNLREHATLIQRLGDAGIDTVVGTSVSLQHVPHDVREETKLDPQIQSWLAFADQKVQQAVTLATGLTEGLGSIETQLSGNDRVLDNRTRASGVHRESVRQRTAALRAQDRSRDDEDKRRQAQRELNLPQIATTTIGSFPQTPEIRQARAAFRAGKLENSEYEDFLRAEIRRVIELQEKIGLDVLVHGEPERNDMVQYFAEHLEGFAVTEHGWVQSYGTRATRPSILWGDVSRAAPITVDWTKYAQSLTDAPVKGMLTGPVTILAWSFVRDDQPRRETAEQVALALRDEIQDLIDAGIRIIQVDEPALRELLPLERDRQAEYLDWSVGAFRLATGGAAPQVQIHTHLCYSEFGAIIDAIDALDADVTSIEAARSRMEVVRPIAQARYSRGIGPGVYDIHSPRIPSEEEVEELLRTAAQEISPRLLWANPDCGLKTRGYDETISSLQNLVAGAKKVRAEVE
jgi:5-methyltetrahydropteroyltriglutamate--homocysteine methyltransferase